MTRAGMWVYLAGLALVGLFGLKQTMQLANTRADLAEARTELATAHQNLAEANNETLRRVAEAERTVRREYEREAEESEPLVERVVVRIRERCMPEPGGGGAGGGAVPSTPGLADEDTQGAGDDRAGADPFTKALERDIRYCRAELNRLARLQDYWRKVSAEN